MRQTKDRMQYKVQEKGIHPAVMHQIDDQPLTPLPAITPHHL